MWCVGSIHNRILEMLASYAFFMQPLNVKKISQKMLNFRIFCYFFISRKKAFLLAFTIYLSEIDQIKSVCGFWDLYEKLSSFPKKNFIGKKFSNYFDPKNIFSDDVYKSKTLYLSFIVCYKAIGTIRFNFGDY